MPYAVQSLPDELFEKISGSLYELVMAGYDLRLCFAQYDHDEEQLEFACYFNEPSEIASYLRSLRRHQEKMPYVKAVYDQNYWGVRYSILFWEHVLAGKSREDAHTLAQQKWGAMPELPKRPHYARSDQRYFYLTKSI